MQYFSLAASRVPNTLVEEVKQGEVWHECIASVIQDLVPKSQFKSFEHPNQITFCLCYNISAQLFNWYSVPLCPLDGDLTQQRRTAFLFKTSYLGPGECFVSQMIVHHSLVLILELTSCGGRTFCTVRLDLLFFYSFRSSSFYSWMGNNVFKCNYNHKCCCFETENAITVMAGGGKHTFLFIWSEFNLL